MLEILAKWNWWTNRREEIVRELMCWLRVALDIAVVVLRDVLLVFVHTCFDGEVEAAFQ
jgi:hypothetical protein